MKIKQLEDGEWVKPRMKGFIHECCECGLRHKVDFKVFYEDKKNPIEMRFTRIVEKTYFQKRIEILKKVGLMADLSELTEREQNIINLRFIKQKSWEEVGVIFGVSRERVRQIESKALDKLHHSKMASGKLN